MIEELELLRGTGVKRFSLRGVVVGRNPRAYAYGFRCLGRLDNVIEKNSQEQGDRQSRFGTVE